MEHEQLGLTLHPFDLATNKVLAMVGRLEVRDWVDVINADRRLQPLGYLLWAACGKDPGHVVRRVARWAEAAPERTLESVPHVCESTRGYERTRMMRDDDIQHSHRTVLTPLVRSTSMPPPAGGSFQIAENR